MRLKEADLERQIADYLSLDDWCCRHLELNWSERKQKLVGERGMPDLLCIRYQQLEWAEGSAYWAQLLWIEAKTSKGRYTIDQRAWRTREKRRGGTVLHMGIDFEASIEGFIAFYEKSGLQRRKVRIGGRRTA